MAGSDYSEEAETPARRAWKCSSVADTRTVAEKFRVAADWRESAAARGRHRTGGFQTLPYSPPPTHGVPSCDYPSGRPIPLMHNAG